MTTQDKITNLLIVKGVSKPQAELVVIQSKHDIELYLNDSINNNNIVLSETELKDIYCILKNTVKNNLKVAQDKCKLPTKAEQYLAYQKYVKANRRNFLLNGCMRKPKQVLPMKKPILFYNNKVQIEKLRKQNKMKYIG